MEISIVKLVRNLKKILKKFYLPFPINLDT